MRGGEVPAASAGAALHLSEGAELLAPPPPNYFTTNGCDRACRGRVLTLWCGGFAVRRHAWGSIVTMTMLDGDGRRSMALIVP